MKKTAFLICILLLLQQVFALPAAAVFGEADILPDQTAAVYCDIAEQQEAPETLEEIANLDLESADSQMKEKILAARERIIFRSSWVADGFTMEQMDADGNIIKKLPSFSELFPAWDVPVDTSIVNGEFEKTSIPYYDGEKWINPEE